MNWGPTLASIQGLNVPTYLRESRNVAAEARMTVTGRGAETSATLFTFDCARHTSRPPTASTASVDKRTTIGMRGDRAAVAGASSRTGGSESDGPERESAFSIVIRVPPRWLDRT